MFKIEKQDLKLELTIGYSITYSIFYHLTSFVNGKIWDSREVSKKDLDYDKLFQQLREEVEAKIDWVNNNWLSVDKEEYEMLVA